MCHEERGARKDFFPPVAGYSPYSPGGCLRGSGDYFDVLVPEYVEPPDLWYCPAGVLFADTTMPPLGQPSGNTFWNYHNPGPGHSYHTQAVYVNLNEKGGYRDIARKLSDPFDWVVVIDINFYETIGGGYSYTSHPGIAAPFGLGRRVRGRTGLGAPFGLNTGTVDGSVKWTPTGECMLGYPGSGGTINDVFTRLLEPPRPGRPGMMP